MLRATRSTRVTRQGTRFVSPARSDRGPHPLSRSHGRISPSVPPAARAAARRDPLLSLRRSARSITPDAIAPRAVGAAFRPASIHWSMPRRALRDPRSFRAVPRPR